MPMKIISVKILRKFWILFSGAEQQLKAWVDEVRQANWDQPSDIKDKFGSASILIRHSLCYVITWSVNSTPIQARTIRY